MASKRTEIINTIVSKIKEISDFENRVYKKITMPDTLKTYPVVNVVPNDSGYIPITAHFYTAGHTENGLDGWDISVLIWVKVAKDVDDEGTLTDELERLTKLVVDKLMEDCSLGLNYVKFIILDSILPVADWKSNIGVNELIFTVKYDFEKGYF